MKKHRSTLVSWHHLLKAVPLVLVSTLMFISDIGGAQEQDLTKHPRYPEFAAQYQAYDRAAGSRDFRTALEPARKSLALAREIFGETSATTGVMYDRLAYAESATGSYDVAIDLYHKAAEIYTTHYGAGHEYVGTVYINIGEAYRSKGDISRALEFHRTAMDIYRKKLGEKHVYVATAYNYMGGALKSKADYRGAIACYEKALSIYREILGEEHEFVATTCINLGGAYEPLGEYGKAIEYYLRAVPIYKKTIGEDHPFLAVAYNNLGLSYHCTGDGENSIKYYNMGLDIYLKTLGPDHAYTAYAYINLGQEYRTQKHYDDSEKYYLKALAILTGSGDRDGRITALTHLGDLFIEKGLPEKASETLGTAVALVLKYRLEIGRGKSGFTDQHIDVFNRIINLEFQLGHTEKAFIADCMKKGLSITEDMTLKDALCKGAVPAQKQTRLLTTINDIETAESDRAVLLQSGNAVAAEAKLKSIWRLESEKDKLDKDLVAEYPAYAALRSPTAPTVDEIVKALGPDQALVSYSLSEKKCLAFVLSKEKGLEVVALGTGDAEAYREIANDSRNIHELYKYPADGTAFAKISGEGGYSEFWNRRSEKDKYLVREKSVFTLDSNSREPDNPLQTGPAPSKEILIGSLDGDLDPRGIKNERDRLSKKLFSALLEPVIKKTPSTKKYVIIPDGPVFYVPLGLLKDSSGTLFSSSQQYCLVHSPAIWLDLRKKAPDRPAYPLLALGNAVYSAGHASSGTATRGRTRSAGSFHVNTLVAGAAVAYLPGAQEDAGFGNLPGTEEEVTVIGNIAYGRDPAAKKHILTGIDANEDMLFMMNDRRTLESYRVIHLAAHGLFIDSNPSLNAIVLTLPSVARESKKDDYASYVSHNGEIRRDGYLRLGEIKTLDLKCDLVVMSACETSLGHYVRGEGMIGLPQAFMIAGSRSVMASLWPVDDEAACMLMEEFYNNLLKKGMPPARALQQAQLTIMNEFTDPFFWAPFTLYGE